MNSPDRAPLVLDATPVAAGHGQPAAASAGALELLLPLWYRKWWLLMGAVLGALSLFGLSFLQTPRFVGQASFVVQPTLRPSMAAASLLPGLAGLVGQGTNPVDLYVTILRSQTIADRVIERFDLHRAWESRSRTETLLRLSRTVGFGVGRRDGLVVVSVTDTDANRAAGMANQYVEELRSILRGYSLDEARQRRVFYDAQLERARSALEAAQRKLQASGFDRGALRAEPRAAADGYARLQAEVTAAEVRLTATRRVRAESSPEVQQQLTELGALRAQLARLEVPRDESPGSFVALLREFRYAEALFESISRQAESARLDEAADAPALRPLDRALRPEFPASPRPLLWAATGFALGLVFAGVVVWLRHRAALARLNPAYVERVALLRTLLGRPGKTAG
jgi:uncharacterized protein involved in exopolysaccharide biosynthesis